MANATFEIEVVASEDAPLLEYVSVMQRLDSRLDIELGLADIRRHDEMVDDLLRLVARVDGEVAANAHVTGAYFDPESTTLPAYLVVDPAHRGVGMGLALYGRMRDWARARSTSPQLTTVVPEADSASVAWWRRRGLSPVDRYVTSELDLTIAPDITPIVVNGIRVVTLEDRPDLEAAAYEAFVETWNDMPGQEFSPPPPDAWTEAAREGRRDPSAWAFAIDDADNVLGVCTTVLKHGDEHAHTGFTGVRAHARGRGIATMLKQHQVDWCQRHGATTLRTNNHDDNAAMRRANDRAGFVELPAQLMLQGVPA